MMRGSKAILFAGVIPVILTLSVWAAKNPPPVTVRSIAPQLEEYTLPVGTPFPVVLQTPIDTAINQQDDPLDAALMQDIYIGARLLLSKNTRFKGHLHQLEKPIQGRNAILAIRLDAILLPDGRELAMAGYVKTERADKTWGGELTEGTVPRRFTHRVVGIGEYNKTVFGGPRAMGAHLQFSPGERWTVILDQPLTFTMPVEN